VFQDAPLEDILHIVSDVQLDVVQLHGSEPTEWAQHIPVPVIRVFHIGKSVKGVDNITRGGTHQFVLLDSLRDDGSGVSGGSGKVVDWELAKKVVEEGEIIVNAFLRRQGHNAKMDLLLWPTSQLPQKHQRLNLLQPPILSSQAALRLHNSPLCLCRLSLPAV
jgi:hypothetical protein